MSKTAEWLDAPEDQVKSGLLLDIVVAQGATILELLAGKDEALLVWRDSSNSFSVKSSRPLGCCHVPLLILNLGLDIIDGVGRLHLEGDRLPREGLDEDLHLTGE